MFEYIKFGGVVVFEVCGVMGFVSGMLGFGEILMDEEIWDIFVYICLIWLEYV